VDRRVAAAAAHARPARERRVDLLEQLLRVLVALALGAAPPPRRACRCPRRGCRSRHSSEAALYVVRKVLSSSAMSRLSSRMIDIRMYTT